MEQINKVEEIEIETREVGKIVLCVKTKSAIGHETFGGGFPKYYTEITQIEDDSQKEKRRNEWEARGYETPYLCSWSCYYYELQEVMEGHNEISEAIRNGHYKLFPHEYLFAVPIPKAVKGKYPHTNNEALFENLPAQKAVLRMSAKKQSIMDTLNKEKTPLTVREIATATTIKTEDLYGRHIPKLIRLGYIEEVRKGDEKAYQVTKNNPASLLSNGNKSIQ